MRRQKIIMVNMAQNIIRKTNVSNALYTLLGTVLFYRALNLSILYKVFICCIVPNSQKYAKCENKHKINTSINSQSNGARA